MTLDTCNWTNPASAAAPASAEDLDPWAAMMADEDAARSSSAASRRARSRWRALMTMIGAWHAHGFAMFSVIEKSSGRWVGRLGPWMPDGWPGTEVGWAIVRDCWGTRLRDRRRGGRHRLGVRSPRLDRVIHSIDPANVASQAWRASSARGTSAPERCPPPFQEARSTSGARRATSGGARLVRSTVVWLTGLGLLARRSAVSSSSGRHSMKHSRVRRAWVRQLCF